MVLSGVQEIYHKSFMYTTKQSRVVYKNSSCKFPVHHSGKMILPNANKRNTKILPILAFIFTSFIYTIISHVLFTFELRNIHLLLGLILKLRTVMLVSCLCILHMAYTTTNCRIWIWTDCCGWLST